jgi:hypothetical protein
MHLLRKFTVNPGRLGDVVAIASEEKWRAIYPGEKLLGSWATEIGPLNQLILLSARDDKNSGAKAEPISSQILQCIVGSEVMELEPRREISNRSASGKLYELRQYNFQPDGMDAFFERFERIVPLRETYSEIVGWWKPASGELQQMVHLWVYDSFEHRAAVRAKCMTDQKWLDYLGTVFPLLSTMKSALLLPTFNSPMR